MDELRGLIRSVFGEDAVPVRVNLTPATLLQVLGALIVAVLLGVMIARRFR